VMLVGLKRGRREASCTLPICLELAMHTRFRVFELRLRHTDVCLMLCGFGCVFVRKSDNCMILDCHGTSASVT
jgi:hypothetical protein